MSAKAVRKKTQKIPARLKRDGMALVLSERWKDDRSRPPVLFGAYLRFEVFNRLTDCLDFFRLLVGNRHIEFFFKFHNEFYRIKRVGSEILSEVCFMRYFSFVDAQFVNDNFLYAFGYSCHIFYTLSEKKSIFRGAKKRLFPGFTKVFFSDFFECANGQHGIIFVNQTLSQQFYAITLKSTRT